MKKTWKKDILVTKYKIANLKNIPVITKWLVFKAKTQFFKKIYIFKNAEIYMNCI